MIHDVVIAGGAAMGSSVAAHLLADPDFRGSVLVVEKDPTYRLAASALSAASIRQQFSQAVNVRLSLHGRDFLRDPRRFLPVPEDAPPIPFEEGGYLYLAGSPDSAERLRDTHALQRREGADIALHAPDVLAARFPWLRVDDLLLGSLGLRGEGWFDGWSLLEVFRRTARSLGATYLRDEVVGVRQDGGRVVAVELASGGRAACGALVDCAGSGGPALAASAGIDIPVRAKRRSVFAFAAPAELAGCPLLIDTSGVWMRREGSGYICGWSPPPDEDPDWRDADPGSQNVDWSLFEEVVWPALAARVPSLEALRAGRAWAGPYDMNVVDHNALVGPAPGIPNLYLCNGFSGHGLQHSPGVGRGLAELIVHGRFHSLDLAALAPSRLVEGRTLLERNVI